MNIGANYTATNECEFRVWAPLQTRVFVKLDSPGGQTTAMTRGERGYWSARLKTPPGTRYRFELTDGSSWPDPASRYQPDGVHASSATVDASLFSWEDEAWRPPALHEWIIYELHVGTFTARGDFDSALTKIDHLVDLGVTAVEIMPVAQFPGARNWGYDGVYPFAVQNSYGGPEAMMRFVNACHVAGLAVILDVVYNHLGPEGNYLRQYGPYFTGKYCTPWGEAVNYDDAYSYGVREYVIANALYWLETMHVDALRLDAVHGIYDMSARHILGELAAAVDELERRIERRKMCIAESDLSDTRIIRPRSRGGYGLDAQWNDDFHHALHVLLTGEQNGYYADFGRVEDLAKAYAEGFVYDWRYSAFRKRFHGSSSADIPGAQMVVCAQNHDQVGNRLLGERLSSLTSFEGLKVSACALMCAPNVPMLFMGEEFAEENPFMYFVNHGDPDLVEAVRKGRREEFASFQWDQAPPDPQGRGVFEQSKLSWDRLDGDQGQALYGLYQRLIRLRREMAPLRSLDKKNLTIRHARDGVLVFARHDDVCAVVCICNFNDRLSSVPAGTLRKHATLVLDTADACWAGPGGLLPDRLGPDTECALPAMSFGIIREG